MAGSATVVTEALLIEVSQSGRGLHIFLPMGPGRGTKERAGGRRVETYPPDSGRYIARLGALHRRHRTPVCRLVSHFVGGSGGSGTRIGSARPCSLTATWVATTAPQVVTGTNVIG